MSDANALDAKPAPLDAVTIVPDLADDALARRSPLPRRSLEPGRLGVYTMLGGAAGVVPLPWLPDLLARRIRGGLVHDIARRHSVTLPRDAREVLAEPFGTDGPRGFLKQARGFVTKKLLSRLGPMALLAPVRASLETFVLGHLFHRYLESVRTAHGRRIDVVEARRVRRAIDQALLAAVTVDVTEVRALEGDTSTDDRDTVTSMIDGFLSRTAGVPSWLVTRLECAFEERLQHVDS